MGVSRDRILFEDEHLLAVTKLAGELTVRGKGAMGKLPLYDFLHKDYPGLRVVHRLDFDTTGVIVFAKTKTAGDAVITSHFADWKKVYRAIVAGVIDRERGVIRAPLPSRGGKGEELVPAVTHFQVLERFPVATYVECQIDTGRHHQIRRHFAAIGHPLALDDIYGDQKFNRHFARATKYHKFFLHAASLDLPHPITRAMLHIDAPLPKAFDVALQKLRSTLR
jgi:RluA family pseudouridine synthase